jgi:hypothetical protein
LCGSKSRVPGGRTNERSQDSRDDAGSPLALAGAGEHVHFSEGGGPGPYVAGLKCALDCRGVAESDLFERLCDSPGGGSAGRYKSRRLLNRRRQHLRQLGQTVAPRGKRRIARALMKGSLHTDVLLHAVMQKEAKLRTRRLISHCAMMSVPTYARRFVISDVALNIAPDTDQKRDICQNAIGFARALGIDLPKVAVMMLLLRPPAAQFSYRVNAKQAALKDQRFSAFSVAHIRCPHARAREAGRRDADRPARPARAAWVVQRLLAARW